MASLSGLNVRLDKEDCDDIVTALASKVLGGLIEGPLRPIVEQYTLGNGIRVLSPRKLSQKLKKSERQLYRMESTGKLPRRRRVALRRTGYLSHEVEEIPVFNAVVADRRTVTREEVAAKLDVTPKTVSRLRDDPELDFPQSVEGIWFERDIDHWLLKRPTV